MEQKKLFDSSFLLEMMDGNIKEVKELAFMLFDLGPQMLLDIEEAVDQKDWKKAGDTAHKLKSSLKLWQMEELIPYSLFIETNGRDGNFIDEIQSNFDLLKTGFNQALLEMEMEFNS